MKKIEVCNSRQIRELALYGIFGALSTLLDVGLFWFFANVINFHYLVANAIAWILAIVFSFLVNKYFVFESKSFKKEVWVKESVEFFSARSLACGVDMGGMYLLVSFLGVNKNYAKLIVTFMVIVINYVLSKFWIFNKK